MWPNAGAATGGQNQAAGLDEDPEQALLLGLQVDLARGRADQQANTVGNFVAIENSSSYHKITDAPVGAGTDKNLIDLDIAKLSGQGRIGLASRVGDLFLSPEGHIDAGEETHQDTGITHHLQGMSCQIDGIMISRGEGHVGPMGHDPNQKGQGEPVLEGVDPPMPFGEVANGADQEEHPWNEFHGASDELTWMESPL